MAQGHFWLTVTITLNKLSPHETIRKPVSTVFLTGDLWAIQIQLLALYEFRYVISLL